MFTVAVFAVLSDAKVYSDIESLLLSQPLKLRIKMFKTCPIIIQLSFSNKNLSTYGA